MGDAVLFLWVVNVESCEVFCFWFVLAMVFCFYLNLALSLALLSFFFKLGIVLMALFWQVLVMLFCFYKGGLKREY